MEAYTSTLTWDEVSYVVEKVLGWDRLGWTGRMPLRSAKKFIDFPRLRFISVDEGIIRRSQVLREKYGLKPRDSIHLSCAIERNISEIISDDQDFDKVREVKRGPITP